MAQGGFHSQAGWIAFILVALGVSLGARSLPWLRVGPAPAAPQTKPPANPTAAYLMPFLAILAAGMVSRAAAGDFEWLYGLRVVAALAVLWRYRREYRDLGSWRPGWVGAAAGVVVFALWIALDRLPGGSPEPLFPLPWPLPRSASSGSPRA